MTDPLSASATRVMLAAQGYTPGAPAYAQALDTTIAQALRCCDCRRPMYHSGYQNNGDYRAFAVCDRCDVATELKGE